MNLMTSALAGRWSALCRQVAEACHAVGRDPGEVTILPVSKTFAPERIRQATELGLRRFGESRLQEIRGKAEALAEADISWVLIGHLQTNKIKAAVKLVGEVQSLDRWELAEVLDRRLQEQGRSIDVLVQLKTSPEHSKQGLPPEQLPRFLQQLKACHSLRLQGLMTVAVHSDDAQAISRCFRQLRQCRERMQEQGYVLPRLSMGMSGDFALAIAEGATELRIGSAIFGTREKQPEQH